MTQLVGNTEITKRERAALARIRRDPRAEVEKTLLRTLMNKELVQSASLNGQRMLALREKGRIALDGR